jgi:hypothetical protein
MIRVINRVILTVEKRFVEDEKKSYPISTHNILHSLYEPTKILQNLVSALIEAAEKNRENMGTEDGITLC